MKTDNKLKETSKKQGQFSAYAKYSGLAIQMGVTIGLFSWLGVWLDESRGTSTPVWTIIFSLIGITIAIYLPIKELISPK